jgi:hypothetical protein
VELLLVALLNIFATYDFKTSTFLFRANLGGEAANWISLKEEETPGLKSFTTSEYIGRNRERKCRRK